MANPYSPADMARQEIAELRGQLAAAERLQDHHAQQIFALAFALGAMGQQFAQLCRALGQELPGETPLAPDPGKPAERAKVRH